MRRKAKSKHFCKNGPSVRPAAPAFSHLQPFWLQTLQLPSTRPGSLRAPATRGEWPWIPEKPGASGNLLHFKEKKWNKKKK